MRSSGKIAVINGPNLSSLGSREPDHYGNTTEEELQEMLRRKAEEVELTIEFFQSDIEGELVREITGASGSTVGLIINPAAYSHYSIAILDAMKAFNGPVVEVHISRIFAREPFRSRLLTAAGADALIAGAGIRGYLHAVDILCELAEVSNT